MANTAVPIDYEMKQSAGVKTYVGDTAQAFYRNARSILISKGNADTAAYGMAKAYVREAGAIPAGLLRVPTGSYDLRKTPVRYIEGDGVNFNVPITQDNVVLENVTVTDSTDARSVGRFIYCTDDNGFSVTPPADDKFPGIPTGHILKWRSGTKFDVVEYGFEEYMRIFREGGLMFNRLLYVGDLATIADGTMHTEEITQHIELVKAYAETLETLVGSGGTISLQINLGANAGFSAVRTVTVASHAAVGSVATASMAATLAEGHQDNDLTIVVSAAGGTRTSGKFAVYGTFRKLSAF